MEVWGPEGILCPSLEPLGFRIWISGEDITEAVKLAAGTHIQQLKLCQTLLVAKTPENVSIQSPCKHCHHHHEDRHHLVISL